MPGLVTRECPHCGGHLIGEREPFSGEEDRVCVNCGRSATTPRRAPSDEERSNQVLVHTSEGFRYAERRRQPSIGGMRL